MADNEIQVPMESRVVDQGFVLESEGCEVKPHRAAGWV